MLRLARLLAYVGFFLMPMFSFTRLYKNLSLSDAFLCLALLVFLASRPKKTVRSLLRNPATGPVLLIVVGAGLSLLSEGASGPAIADTLTIGGQLLFSVYALTTLLFFCRVRIALAMIALSTGFLSTLAMLFLAGLLNLGVITMPFSRLSLASIEPNVAARVLFIGTTIAFFRFRGVLWFALRWFGVAGMLATFSRSGFLALSALIVGAARRGRLLVLAGFVSLIGIVFFAPVGAQTEIGTYLSRIHGALHLTDYNTIMRVDQISGGLRLLAASDYLGIGLGNYPDVVGAVPNTFFGMGVEAGLLGLVGYLLLYLSFFKLTNRLEHEFGMLHVLFLGTLAFDMFMTLSTPRICWLPVSLVFALYLKNREAVADALPGAIGTRALGTETRDGGTVVDQRGVTI